MGQTWAWLHLQLGHIDGDNYPELVIDGEWMPCKIFKNQKGVLRQDPQVTGLSDKLGMYEATFPD